MHYRVHGTKVKCLRWYPTKAEAISAFERASKRVGIAPPLDYPPAASGDSITINIAYLRRKCSAGLCEGHGTVYVEVRNGV